MRIVLGIHSLAGLGGTESYVTTIGDHLQRDGHDVWIYAAELGVSAEIADSLGLRVVTSAHDLPADLDVALPQDAPASLEIAIARPQCPQIFISHTDIFDVGVPPQIHGLIRAVVTLYRRARERIVAQAIELPVERLCQPVDVERFKPTTVLPDQPRLAVSFGNYLAGARLEMVAAACERAGIDFETAGCLGGGLELRPEELLNKADIVFGKAKIVHEAMACGRAVYVLDHNGAEGWVTAENYAELVEDNFGGRSHPRPVSAESLAADLRGYDPAMGLVNRDLIVAHHAAVKHTSDLVHLIRKYVDGSRADPDARNLLEIARLARVNWRHESDAFRLRKLLEIRSLELSEADRMARGAYGDARVLLERLEDNERRFAQLIGSRRHRTVSALMRPFDRLRGRAR